MSDVKEITEEKKQEVLMKVGSFAIAEAISREGILVVGDPMTVSWRKAETWAKTMAHKCSVSEEVLKHLIVGELNKRIIEEVQRHD